VWDPFDPGNRQAESTPDGLHDVGRPIEIFPTDRRSLGSESGDAIRKSGIAGSQFSISECDQGAQSASRWNWSDDEAIPHSGHGNVGEPGDLVDGRRQRTVSRLDIDLSLRIDSPVQEDGNLALLGKASQNGPQRHPFPCPGEGTLKCRRESTLRFVADRQRLGKNGRPRPGRDDRRQNSAKGE
jgi:hypothetical protein